MSRRKYTVISGSIFSVWQRIEHRCKTDDQFYRIQMIRLKTSDGGKIVGVLLPEKNVDDLIDDFEQDSEKIDENSFGDDDDDGAFVLSDDDY